MLAMGLNKFATGMVKYVCWPRGEEETRLSAKQLCTSSILVVASNIYERPNLTFGLFIV